MATLAQPPGSVWNDCAAVGQCPITQGLEALAQPQVQLRNCRCELLAMRADQGDRGRFAEQFGQDDFQFTGRNVGADIQPRLVDDAFALNGQATDDVGIVTDQRPAHLHGTVAQLPLVVYPVVLHVQQAGVLLQGVGAERAAVAGQGVGGCHQPSDRVACTIIPFAWFAQGMRLVDIADPFNPREVGHFTPDAPKGGSKPSSNDVTIDDRGLIYLVDRVHGVDIIETSVF